MSKTINILMAIGMGVCAIALSYCHAHLPTNQEIPVPAISQSDKQATDSQIVTPENLLKTGVKHPTSTVLEGTLKKGQTFHNEKAGYEFTLLDDMFYHFDPNLGDRYIFLFSSYGDDSETHVATSRWPSISIYTVADLSTNYNLLQEAEHHYRQFPLSGLNPTTVTCDINGIPCVKIELRRDLYAAQHADAIYLARNHRLLKIFFEDINTQAAQDYYQNFLNTFKFLPSFGN